MEAFNLVTEPEVAQQPLRFGDARVARNFLSLEDVEGVGNPSQCTKTRCWKEGRELLEL